MNFSHLNSVLDAKDLSLGIVAPDGRDGMLQHAREFSEAGVPFIFDPGQGLPMFDGEELMRFVEMADFVATNDYEATLLQDRTGKTVEQLAKSVKAFIVTQGPQGSLIHAGGREMRIPAVPPERVVDPTGCGDAYRAGLLYGIGNDLDWETTGRLASLLGSIKIAERGAQNHQFTRDQLAQRYRQAFNATLW
jgi:adenosine kinase